MIRGEIGAVGLADWWLSEFTADEREYIESIYQPIGVGASNPRPLTQGTVEFTGLTATFLLTCLATWFTQPGDRPLARRILAKAEQESTTEPDVLTLHSFWEMKRRVYYADWETDPEALQIAIHACEQQIAIAPAAIQKMKLLYSTSAIPKHAGYQQLAMIRAQQKNYSEAIRLCQIARDQGWKGDWDKQIARYQKQQGRRNDEVKS